MRNNVEAKNAKLDEILDRADSLLSSKPPERIEHYQEAEKLMMDEAYYNLINWHERFLMVKPWVKNLETNNSLALYAISRMYLAKR